MSKPWIGRPNQCKEVFWELLKRRAGLRHVITNNPNDITCLLRWRGSRRPVLQEAIDHIAVDQDQPLWVRIRRVSNSMREFGANDGG